jgi:hypothetical protein
MYIRNDGCGCEEESLSLRRGEGFEQDCANFCIALYFSAIHYGFYHNQADYL